MGLSHFPTWLKKYGKMLLATSKYLTLCECNKTVETSKMSLQNLQNIHSTNRPRVVDLIVYFCSYHLLRGVRELCLVS